MKKSIVLVAVVSLVFASCGRSGWSCKKRYCDLKKDKIETINKETNKKEIILNRETVIAQP